MNPIFRLAALVPFAAFLLVGGSTLVWEMATRTPASTYVGLGTFGIGLMVAAASAAWLVLGAIVTGARKGARAAGTFALGAFLGALAGGVLLFGACVAALGSVA